MLERLFCVDLSRSSPSKGLCGLVVNLIGLIASSSNLAHIAELQGAEMMSKYAGLTDYLQARTEREFVLTFDELAVIIEGYLPKSAERPRYWENTANAGNRASRCAGYQSTLLQGSNEVRFIRI